MDTLQIKILNTKIFPILKALATLGWIEIKDEQDQVNKVNEVRPAISKRTAAELTAEGFITWIEDLQSRAEAYNISDEEIVKLTKEVRKEIHASSKG